MLANRNRVWLSPEILCDRQLEMQMCATNHWADHRDLNGGVRGQNVLADGETTL